METIVVGVGEQRTSDAAVMWAGAEADRRGWQLALLRGLPYPNAAAAGMGAWYPEDLLGELDALAFEELHAARASLAAAFPALRVRASVEHVDPRLALTRASETAGMVVIGARNHGAFMGVLIGSTSLHVAAHSRCPVAVVHAPPVPGATGVVVGHDGSPAAQEAVEFAAEVAAAHGEDLLIIHAWFLSGLFPGGFNPGRYVARAEDEEVAQRDRLEAVAAAVRSGRPGLVVRTELLVDAFASQGLVSAARAARLLVVGSRGRGAFASMLLGSTSRNVLQTTRTPVVVVADRARVLASAPIAEATEEHAAPAPMAVTGRP